MRTFKNDSTETKTSVELNPQTKVDLLPGQVVTTQNDALSESDEDFTPVVYGEDVRQVVVTMTTAEILNGNTAAKELVPAPGAGKAVKVDEIIATNEYGSVVYATNTTMEFRYTDWSGTKVAADNANILLSTADEAISVGGIEAELALTINAAVVAVVATGDPTAGNSDVKLTVIYRIVTI